MSATLESASELLDRAARAPAAPGQAMITLTRLHKGHTMETEDQRKPLAQRDKRKTSSPGLPAAATGFFACSNADGTAHVAVTTDSSGYIFADGFTDLSTADWAATALNAALRSERLSIECRRSAH